MYVLYLILTLLTTTSIAAFGGHIRDVSVVVDQ
jgi:hypothetical protein